MGNKQTIFTDEQLDAYQDCTFFTRKEILRLHGRYHELAPNMVPMDYTKNPDVKLPLQLIENMPELKKTCGREHRILQAASELTSIHIKAAKAEKNPEMGRKDFNTDNFICKSDLEQTLNKLTKEELTKEEVSLVCEKHLPHTNLKSMELSHWKPGWLTCSWLSPLFLDAAAKDSTESWPSRCRTIFQDLRNMPG
ncbi:hypothetical protein Chor_014686 [Crotalus horridus]